MGLLKAIDGYKTILGALGWALLLIFDGYGEVSPEVFGWASAALAGWTGFALKHAIEKSEPGKKN